MIINKRRFLKVFLSSFVLLSCVFLDRNSLGTRSSNMGKIALDSLSNNKEISSEQVIIAFNKEEKSYNGILFGLELIKGKWKVTFDTIPCTFGKNGIADPDQKFEGDGKTPSGTFPIGSAFGYHDNIDVEMKFIELSNSHYWVSDTSSNLYNQLISYYPENLFVEKMKRNDHLYKYGIIIEYNTPNPIKGKGSAIFIHIERKKGDPTAGCIAISEEDIIELISWIQPLKNPLIVIATT